MQDRVRCLGRSGAQEVVAAVGELVQVDALGKQLPVAVAADGYPAVLGSSAATTTVTGADSRVVGGASSASAR